MGKQFFFSVGEPSGDLHAAKLIHAMRELDPELRFRGFGGAQMAGAGFDCDFDLTQMAVIGIFEVLPKIREFYRIADQASAIFDQGKIDGVILVDFPGFNWHIAKRAKQRGIPVYYYMPPQLWVWGGWRVHKLKRTVDRVLCNLPFEKTWFDKHGVDCEYVGHPFFDEIAERTLDREVMRRAERKPARLQVAILPGSRNHEVHSVWPIQLEVIRRLHRQFPTVDFLVAAYQEKHAEWCRSQMRDEDRNLPMEILVGKTSEILELADCALIKSGSVSLELMARGTPAVVMYRVTRFSRVLVSLLTRCRYMSLPNLMAEEEVMPEFLSAGSAERACTDLVEAMRRMLGDQGHREAKQSKLAELTACFARPGATRRAAEAILASEPTIIPFRKVA